MYALTALINSTASSRNLINQPTWWRVFFLFLLASLFFALSPTAQAVTPAPDGGYGNGNTAEGDDALFSNTTGSANTATGFQALFSNTTGSANTASGDNALQTNTTGSENTANGVNALRSNSTGNYNTAEGYGALFGNTTGSLNVAIGIDAGFNLTTGSNNIVIGANVLGNAGESGKIRLGKQGTQTATYIAGIYGKTVASGTKVGVMIDSTGKLGTVVSSARFKEAIKPMD